MFFLVLDKFESAVEYLNDAKNHSDIPCDFPSTPHLRYRKDRPRKTLNLDATDGSDDELTTQTKKNATMTFKSSVAADDTSLPPLPPPPATPDPHFTLNEVQLAIQQHRQEQRSSNPMTPTSHIVDHFEAPGERTDVTDVNEKGGDDRQGPSGSPDPGLEQPLPTTNQTKGC